MKYNYNCNNEELFITFKTVKHFLAHFSIKDLNLDFVPDDLDICLTQNEQVLETIKYFLVNIIANI
jgi:hypothetical protein